MINNNLKENFFTEIQNNIIKDEIQKVVVGAIIVNDDNKVLLLERIADDFMGGLIELPSGGVDSEETILQGLEREVKEETGLTILKIDNFVGSFDYKSGSGKKARQLNFLVSVDKGDVVLEPKEHCNYEFVSVDEENFKNLNISEQTKDIIYKAFKEK